VSLTVEELTDLLIDAWHFGKRDAIEAVKQGLD
jgi:hypothetical protein